MDALVELSENDTRQLKLLQAQIEQIHQGVTISSLDPAAQDQLRKLLHLSEDVLQKITQQRILSSLAFSDMHGRFEIVETAHFKTFEWIFGDRPQEIDEEEDEVGEEQEQKESNADPSAGKLFSEWLSSGQGIFHISGKLGSGKSTLMKFLCDHPRTKTELLKWAGTCMYAVWFIHSHI